MKEKIGPSKEEFQFESPKFKNFPENKEENNEILEGLDEKIAEIKSFLNDDNLKKAEKAGVSEGSRKKLEIIKRNISGLIPLLNDPEIKLIKNSHFCDRLGNFCGCLGLAERIIKKKRKEDVSEKLIAKFEDQVIRYHNYFSECITNDNFLKEELETADGEKMH